MRYVAALTLALAGCASVPDGPTAFEFSPPAVSDVTATKEEITLDEALKLAEALNPELQALRRDIEIAAAETRHASLYSNPSVFAETEDYRTKGSNGLSGAERTLGVGVPIVLSGRIGAATAVAQKQREIAAWVYAWERRKKLIEVKKAFFQLLALQQYRALTEDNRDVAKAFHEVSEQRFRAQAVPEMEVLKSSVALAKAEADLRTVEGQWASALSSLKASIGNVDLAFTRVAGTLPSKFEVPALQALKAPIFDKHPLVERALRAKEQAEAELSLAKAEAWPDVSVQVAMGKGPEDDTIVEGGVSVPLPLFNRNQWKVAAAEHRIRRAEHEIEAAKNEVLRRLESSYHAFVAAQHRVDAYRGEILPKALRALASSNEGYRQGKFNYLDVLDAQRTVAEARIALVFALLDLNSSASELELITGSKLRQIE